MPTREAIKGKLQKELDATVARYRSMSQEELTSPCTESEADDGAPWSAKDHLAHLAMIERSFAAMIRRGIEGDPHPVGLGGSGGPGGDDIRSVLERVHRGNEDNVNAHRDDDLETLLADLHAARRETLELLDELDDEQLTAALPGAPWADGTIGGVLITNGYHHQQHVKWVEEGLTSK